MMICGKVLAEKGLQALDAIAEGEDHATGATLVEVTRAKGQAVLVKILTNLDLDDVGSVVSVAVLQVLEYSSDADEDGDADHGKSKGGVLGLSAKDLGDDYAEDGEARNPGPDRDESKDCRKENSEPNALREPE